MAQYSLYRPWATASRGGPLDQLRQEMDAVLNRFGGGTTPSSSWRGVFPAVNLYEAADNYVLMAELPGIESEDIQVSLERSTVVIEGERKIDYANQEGVSLHRRERQVGSFRRAFELPVGKAGLLVLLLDPTHQRLGDDQQLLVLSLERVRAVHEGHGSVPSSGER